MKVTAQHVDRRNESTSKLKRSERGKGPFEVTIRFILQNDEDFVIRQFPILLADSPSPSPYTGYLREEGQTSTFNSHFDALKEVDMALKWAELLVDSIAVSRRYMIEPIREYTLDSTSQFTTPSTGDVSSNKQEGPKVLGDGDVVGETVGWLD